MRNLLLASALISLPMAAHATLITAFSQQQTTNSVTATDNGTVTTINYSNVLTTLGGGILGVIPGALMSLTAHSIDAVVNVAGNLVQHYSGNFCISSGAGCTGNFLSGVFTDAAFGANGGPGLTVNVSNPPESLSLASNVLPASELLAPSSFNLAFTNVAPGLHVDGTTIGAFVASFAGDISASSVAVSEPAALGLLALGMAGIVLVRRPR